MALFRRSLLLFSLLISLSITASAAISEFDVRTKIESDIHQVLIDKYPTLQKEDISIDILNFSEFILRLPDSTTKLSTQMKDKGDLLGKLVLRVNYFSDSDFLGSYALIVDLDAKMPFFVADKPLDSGTILNKELLREEYRSLKGANRETVHNINDILGKELRFKVHQDNIIVSWMLKGKSVVFEGDILKSHFKNSNVEVTVKSKALEDGKKGDKIRVRLLHNNRIAIAKVLEKDHVAIYTNF